MTTFEEDLFEIMRETFMEDEYYVNDCKKPAFLISCTQINPDKWQIIIGGGLGLYGTYPSHKKAMETLKTVIENAFLPVKVYRTTRHRKTKVLFAENKISRVDLSKVTDDDVPVKLFDLKFKNTKEEKL